VSGSLDALVALLALLAVLAAFAVAVYSALNEYTRWFFRDDEACGLPFAGGWMNHYYEAEQDGVRQTISFVQGLTYLVLRAPCPSQVRLRLSNRRGFTGLLQRPVDTYFRGLEILDGLPKGWRGFGSPALPALSLASRLPLEGREQRACELELSAGFLTATYETHEELTREDKDRHRKAFLAVRDAVGR